MEQDWAYYAYFGAAVALFTLFMRVRQRGGSQFAIISAIVVVVGLLLFIAAANR